MKNQILVLFQKIDNLERIERIEIKVQFELKIKLGIPLEIV